MRRAFYGCALFVVVIGGASVLGRPGRMSPSSQTPENTRVTIAGGAPGGEIEKRPDGVVLTFGDGILQLQVKSESIVRVLYSKTRQPAVDSMMVIGPDGVPGGSALNPFVAAPASSTARKPTTAKWTLKTSSTQVTLVTARLQAIVDRSTAAVTFADSSGRTVLAEMPAGRRMTPATVQGEPTHHVQQSWQANADESLYGLGERQEGKLDIKGYDFDLWQRNTYVAMPVLMSSRGYGILWDNTSFTKFGDTRPFEPIPAANLIDANGDAGALSQGTVAAATDQTLQNAVRVSAIDVTTAAAVPPGGGRGAAPPVRGWAGAVRAPVTGDYQFQTYSNGEIKMWVGNDLRIDHYKQNWAAENDQFKVHLNAGETYPVRLTLGAGATTLRLMWKTPPPAQDTALWSEVGDAIDYYFMYGPDLDQVVAGYRTLTGRASMLPQWAFGFWQSKNKYNTQQEVLTTLAEFRKRQIPIDNIVQDWQYWAPDAWGDHTFEASRYPNPNAMIASIHDQHARFMISVWGKFYPETANFKALNAINGLYLTTVTDGTRDWLNRNYVFYDVFNAPARRMFWEQVNSALFSKGVDAWWMDATEPDVVQPSPPTLETLRHNIDRTAIGTASRVMNAYPLMNSEAVYDGQRHTAPNQRVFILTRSGFPGIQRYATVTWSGDITSTWATLRKQITAGLGFSVSGDPYWTTDTGGYTMEPRFASARDGEALEEWRELNARWFEYSTFCPLLRVHGTDRPREMWNIGDETTPVYQAELKSDQLRYALFPYLYALSGAVTQDHYTLMRPLVMDFRSDVSARTASDQFMFGPAFLVSPVTQYKARNRQLYLPGGTAWYDFWTGRKEEGGRTITAEAPYDRIPVHVRAGSIVPTGPAQQYIGEKPATSLAIYVYAGADGRFSLYEDDGLTYGYESGQFSRIPITWSDKDRTLTVGARSGMFPGMIANRTFSIVLVSAQSPTGYSPAPAGARSIEYRGSRVQMKF